MEISPVYKSKNFHVATSDITCWSCQSKTIIYSIFVKNLYDLVEDLNLEEPVSLSYITHLNNQVLDTLQKVTQGRFRKDFSYTAEDQYFMNHCEKCSAKIGDFYIFKPGGPFSPISSADFEKLDLTEYDLELFVDSGYNMGSAINVFQAKQI